MKIGEEVYIHGYVDEIRKDTVIIRNEGGYFGTVPGEIKENRNAEGAIVGHWIATENEEMEIDGYYCSNCDLPMETKEKTCFCPHCGADMRGRTNERS